jgi:hypothetical protein
MNMIVEKLTRIDERQQGVLIRLDAISSNLRAHVVGERASTPNIRNLGPNKGLEQGEP